MRKERMLTEQRTRKGQAPLEYFILLAAIAVITLLSLSPFLQRAVDLGREMFIRCTRQMF